jgi:phosphoglycolate phosphatase
VSPDGLVCFDLDGCLVDSDRAIGDGLTHALRTVGLRAPEPDAVRPLIGPPLVTSIRALLEAAGVDTAAPEGAARLEAAVAAYRARYATQGFALTTVVPGMRDALAAVTQQCRGARLVVVTAKPRAVAEPLLAHLGLRATFAAVHGVGLGLAVESKAVTLARALEEHGVPAAAAVMIGDREHDVRAGRACGTATVGVLWGAGPRTEREAAGADVVVDAPAALADVIVRISQGWSAAR